MKAQRELARLLATRDRTPSGLSAPQVQYSSIEDGSIKEYDEDGNLVSETGQQWDGSHGSYPLTGPTPPRPTAPTVEGGTSATISWDGLFLGEDGKVDLLVTPPMDWSRVEIHISQTKGFVAETADTLVDTIETPRGGSRPALPGPGTWYAVLVARSLAGKRSEQSPETQFEVEPGISEADIQAIRDEFGETANDLARALQENVLQQNALGEDLDRLVDTTLPAMRQELEDAGERLDSADQLLNVSFPKRLTDVETKANNASTTATQAQTKAAAAETAASKAAADLVTAKNRADAAAAAATTAAAEAAAAEEASTRATGAAGEAEAAADLARQDAAAALTAAQNSGGDVTKAQKAATDAQTAADTARTQAAAAGTSAAAADAKAAQAAADAAKAAADATKAAADATKAAGEATTAKNSATTATQKATAAETAAAAAKTRADTAAADAATAATKATAAETSATRATGAAGTAETAADKARQDAAAALTQAQNAGSNATAAQTAANAAKAASDTAKSEATKAGTAAAAADAAAAKAAADAAQAAADLIVARNAAADARGDADTALARADSAIAQAGSAARVLYSTGNPSGTAREGDTWRKTASDVGHVVAEWRYTKNAAGVLGWRTQQVTTDMISNLDVGKLTAGSGTFIQAVAEKMAAATAAFQKADIGNLTVTGTSVLNDLVAEKMAAKIGLFVEVKTSQLTADNANFKTGVAEKFAAGVGSFLKLNASQVYIGQPGNSMPDPNFIDPEMTARRNANSTCTVEKVGVNLRLNNTSTSMQYFRPLGVPQTPGGIQEWIPVTPGEVWSFEYTANMAASATVQFVGRTLDGSAYKNPTQKNTAPNVLKADQLVATIPADCYWIMPEIYAPPGQSYIVPGTMTIRRVITPALVVDGLVSGQNIIGAQIQTVAAANRGVKITDAGMFAYNSSGVETLRFDGANSIITGATLRTAASGARWQMSAAGLEAWGSDGVRYLLGNATGLEMIGSISSKGKTAEATPRDINVRLTTVTRNLMGKTNVPNPSLVFDTGDVNLGTAPGIYSPLGDSLILSGKASAVTGKGKVEISEETISLDALRVVVGAAGVFRTEAVEVNASAIQLGFPSGVFGNTVGTLHGEWQIGSGSFINGGTRHLELRASGSLANNNTNVFVSGLTIQENDSESYGFATVNSAKNQVNLQPGVYAVTFKMATGSSLGSTARIAITGPGAVVTHMAEVLTNASWDGQVTHPNLYLRAGGDLQFQVRQNGSGAKTMTYTVAITKMS